jgi:phosphoribosyl 1,2-cyclic phosphodiesterase
MGIQVYCSRGTAEEIDLSSFYQLKSGSAVNIGTFLVIPFETQHDAAEPLGFFIYSSKTKEKLLFATDTYYIKYRFAGLTHIMIEVNYSEETLDPETPYIDRLRESHFSLENVLEFLDANDLTAVEEIHLIHLSSRNGDGELFKNRIAAATGKYVVVAGE